MAWPLVVAALLGALAPEDLRPFAPPDGQPTATDVEPAPAPTSAAPDPPAPPPVAAPFPDLRVRVYLKDLDHLAEVMHGDPKVGAMATSLVQRRNTARTVAIVGFATGVGLGLAATSAFASWDTQANPGSPAGPPSSATGLFIASAVTLLAATVVTAMVAPRFDELLDVVNAWNRGHPDEQVDLAWAPSILQAPPPEAPVRER